MERRDKRWPWSECNGRFGAHQECAWGELFGGLSRHVSTGWGEFWFGGGSCPYLSEHSLLQTATAADASPASIAFNAPKPESDVQVWQACVVLGTVVVCRY